ncbi:MAG: sulfatase-like hydrolase/transferase [Anaerolineaceae bacterium]|nr:sulfatase-like hydrolase/transferase [Anaerolineaceae bacterium]
MAKPNILFILIDDLGWRDLACYGSTFYETPNLDRLAAEGMLFTNAYASCPVCSPTRASIMSGKYPARVGVTQFIGGKSEGKLADVPYLHYLPLEEKSLAAALREAGYQTWHVGKWHLGDEDFYPEHHGFDVNIGGCHWGMPAQGYFSPWGIATLEDGPEGQYLTDRLTDEAIHLVRNRGDRPFLLHLAHYAVHIPIESPSDLVEKYRRKSKAMGLDGKGAIVAGEHFPCLHKQDQRVQRRVVQSDPAYAAMIENLDTNIGRLLETLEEEGIADNTLVVFTADNGGLSTAEGSPTCNHPLSEGKGWNYEGGTRVCQMARWPGRVAPGSRCSVPVTSTDFYPTFLEACGAPLLPEQHCDGLSLMPLLGGGSTLDREAIFWHYPHYSNQGGSPAASVVCGHWKLIELFENGELELYNLSLDIGEHSNVAAEHPDLVEDLRARLKAWQREIEARIPKPNPDYLKKLKQPKTPNNSHI